jgi:hypothetical protein
MVVFLVLGVVKGRKGGAMHQRRLKRSGLVASFGTSSGVQMPLAEAVLWNL